MFELSVLKKYYNNREIFEGMKAAEEAESPHKHAHSPKKTAAKNQYELMDARVEKLKNYQQYYAKNWQIIGKYNFDFDIILSKFQEVQSIVKSQEIQHNELVKIVTKKKEMLHELITMRNQMKSDSEFFHRYPVRSFLLNSIVLETGPLYGGF